MNLPVISPGISAFVILACTGLCFRVAPLSAKILFRDDFDTDMNQWKSYHDNEVFLDVRDGKLIFESRKEKVVTSWNYLRRYREGNYRISTEITRQSGPEANDGGLALKNPAGVECYLGILGNSRYVITAYDPDENKNILRTGSGSFIHPQNIPNKLRIELGKRKVYFFVNDHLLEEIDDFSLEGFWIGFRVAPQIRIQVDYIELSSGD